MAEINHTVDKDDLERSVEPVPAGTYIAIIESSDYVKNKQETGMILNLTYQIIDEPFKGRKVFENLNLENPSQQAVEISRRALNSIGVATGVGKIQDSAQIHDIPMYIDVIVKDDANYGPKNVIRKHIAIEDNSQQQSAPQSQQQKNNPPVVPNAGADNNHAPKKKYQWD